jgi:glycosyltransferase involved in cell wall biosynthesis
VKLLFDASTLGTAHARPLQGRTGVFRASEQILRALSSQAGVSLSLCARARTPDTIAWRDQDTLARNIPFQSTWLQRMASRHGSFRWAAAIERAARPSALGGEAEAILVPHFHHLPSASHRFASRVLLLHDVLPLTHPQWFAGDEPRILATAAKRIEDEGWTLVFDTVEAMRQAQGVIRFSSEQAHVVPLGVDHGLFHPPMESASRSDFRARLGLTGPWFCTLGTLEPRKNLTVVIRAFRKFLEATESRDTKLVLAGTRGWKTEALEAALAEAGDSRSNIVLPGFLSDQDLPLLYHGASAFLFPSLAEGFGLPPLEAMACGAPVISSNASCMPEVLGDSAFWVAPDDVGGWTDALALFSRSEETRQRHRQLGLDRAAGYTWHRTAEVLVSVIERDLDRRIRTRG